MSLVMPLLEEEGREELSEPRYAGNGRKRREELSEPRYALPGEKEERRSSLSLVMLFQVRRKREELSEPRYALPGKKEEGGAL